MTVEASTLKKERSAPTGVVLASQVKQQTCQGYRCNHDRRQAPPPDKVVNHVFSLEIKLHFGQPREFGSSMLPQSRHLMAFIFGPVGRACCTLFA